MTDEDQMREMARIQAEGMRAMSEKELAARDLRIAPLMRQRSWGVGSDEHIAAICCKT